MPVSICVLGTNKILSVRRKLVNIAVFIWVKETWNITKVPVTLAAAFINVGNYDIGQFMWAFAKHFIAWRIPWSFNFLETLNLFSSMSWVCH